NQSIAGIGTLRTDRFRPIGQPREARGVAQRGDRSHEMREIPGLLARITWGHRRREGGVWDERFENARSFAITSLFVENVAIGFICLIVPRPKYDDAAEAMFCFAKTALRASLHGKPPQRRATLG